MNCDEIIDFKINVYDEIILFNWLLILIGLNYNYFIIEIKINLKKNKLFICILFFILFVSKIQVIFVVWNFFLIIKLKI